MGVVTQIDWDQCRERLLTNIEYKLRSDDIVYGVPRGGQHVAAMLASRYKITDDADAATVFVDDIIDSGKTCQDYKNKFGRQFYALVDKRLDADREAGFVVFPWEKARNDSGVDDNVRRLLQYIGEDPDREGLIETPQRVVSALRELTCGYRDDPASILAKRFSDTTDEMIAVTDIEVWSMCEHHMLPFHGKAHVAYVPNDQVVGLSKIARLVDCFARRLQIQERLTQQIAEALMTHVQPKGAAVVIEATHLCMAMRGVNKPSRMSTSALLGCMRETGPRQEFFSLCKRR